MYRDSLPKNLLSEDSAEGGLGLSVDIILVECGSYVCRMHPDYQRGTNSISTSAQRGGGRSGRGYECFQKFNRRQRCENCT